MIPSTDMWRGVQLAADLANTSPVVWHDDRLPDVVALAAFLDERGINPPHPLTCADVAGVHRLRDRLYAVFFADQETDAVADLNAALWQAAVIPQLRATGHGWGWHLASAGPQSIVGTLTALAAGSLLQLIAQDGLARLGGCAADRCHGVYVDTTRNRSRRYCLPELCGNRENLAAFRARQRANRDQASGSRGS